MRLLNILRQRRHATVLLAGLVLINVGLRLPGADQNDLIIPVPALDVASIPAPRLHVEGDPETPAMSLAAELETVYELEPDKAASFGEWITDAADQSGVPATLLASVIRTESEFRLNARSRVGAIGPGQVRPTIWSKTCADIGPLHEPAANIGCAARILAHYNSDVCDGDWRCTLASYNVGPRAYRKSRAMRAAGQRYVAKVTAHLTQHPGVDGLP